MPRNYDANDLFWTFRGDFCIHNGDIMDTENDPLKSLVQEIKTRISSDIGSWKGYQDLGSNISDFIGQPNNKVTAEQIKTRMISALSRHGFMHTRDIKISYLPIDIDKLLFRISINILPTLENLSSDSLIMLALYNYEENQVYYSI